MSERMSDAWLAEIGIDPALYSDTDWTNVQYLKAERAKVRELEAEVAALRSALVEAMSWNWLYDDADAIVGRAKLRKLAGLPKEPEHE